MNIYLNQARRHSRPAMSSRRRRNRRHDALIIGALGVLAVIMALAWLAEHLMVLTGAALLMWGVFHLGQPHERRRARPGQVVPPRIWPGEPASAPAVPAVTLPSADYDWNEPVTRQPAVQPPGRSDRDKLLADPLSGAHPLGRP